MKQFKQVVLIVLDGVGIGALPDAADYGDETAATLPHVAEAVGGLDLANLQSLGLGNICEIRGVLPQYPARASWGKMVECSAGKDSVSGHWEIAGHVRRSPFASFPQGFSPEIIRKFTDLAGKEPLGNIAASGTDILCQFGEQHLASGQPIVYTSSDSVFQIAAHEKLLPPTQLYRLCEQTLKMLRPYDVCRVIARPFIGDRSENFKRTSKRHDFTVAPGAETILDRLQHAAVSTCGIGKVGDLFSGRGLDLSLPTRSNTEGLKTLLQVLKQLQNGLIFVNLVDFDMLYGHRCDARGFAAALREFDSYLPQILTHLTAQGLLLITADHGCDPTIAGTDHCREYVPLLAWSKQCSRGCDLGVRSSFSDISATLAEIFALGPGRGDSFLATLLKKSE